MPSPITILTSSDGKLTTKRWYRAANGTVRNSSYEKAYQFRADVYEVKDIRDFYKAVKWLEPQPNSFVIRGVPTDGVDRTKPVLRRSRPDVSGKVWFEEHTDGLPWVMLDFDKISVPAGTDLGVDPADAIEYLIGLLPEAFWDASCVWQLSSSAGMGDDDVISAHLTFWFDRPVLNAELKVWASEVNAEIGLKLIDPALFQTIQPHYTAAPIFNGVADPIQRRSGFREGLEDVVAFPQITAPSKKYIGAYTGSSESVLHRAQGFDAKLEHIGDGSGLAGFHAPLLEAAASYVGTHGADGTDPDALKAKLRRAIFVAPKARGRDVGRYLSDQYLDDIINSAIQKFGGNLDNHSDRPFFPPYYPHVTESKAHALERQNLIIGSWGQAVQRIIEIRRRYETERTKFHNDIDADDLIENPSAQKAAATRGLRVKYCKEYRNGSLHSQRLVITGSQGSGKTSKAIKAVAGMHDGIIIMLVPTSAKAEEIYSDYDALCSKKSLPAMVMRGRGASATEHQKMCARHGLAERVAKAGLSVSQTLCRSNAGGTCPHFTDCPYQEQLRDLYAIRENGRGVIFAAHQYAFSASVLPEPDAWIIDESIVLKATSIISFNPDRIIEIGRAWSDAGADVAADYAVLAKKVVVAIESGQPILQAMRDTGITVDDLDTCLSFTDAVGIAELDGAGPGATDAAISVALTRIEALEVKKVESLFRQLKREYDLPRNRANGITFDPNATVLVDGKSERQKRLKVHSLLAPKLRSRELFDQAPLLILDGTGDSGLVRRVFGEDVEHHHIPMERWAEVTQVRGYFAADQTASRFATMTFSRQAMTGKDRIGNSRGPKLEAAAEIRRYEVAEIVNGLPGSVFVGGSKSVVSGNHDDPGVLNSLLGPNCETGHYNSIRGLNRYETCGTAVIVGREQPSAEALEGLARCFANSDPVPFCSVKDENGIYAYVLQCRGRRLRDGNGQAEVVEVHPEPIAQAILEQIREAEILQTIDRVRPIFNVRRIIILTSVVLDITVDRALTWKDLKAFFALERAFPDVMPLRHDLIQKLFPSLVGAGKVLGAERTLKGFLGRVIKSATSQIDIIWKLALYKIGHQKRSSTALFRAELSNPREALERQIGDPVTSFEFHLGPDVYEYTEPPALEADGSAHCPTPPIVSPTPQSIDIGGPPFPGGQAQGRPVHPQPPSLIVTNPAPDPTPEPGSFEIDEMPNGTPEEIYQQIVAGMDDSDWLDIDAADAEAARRWLLAM